MGGTILEILNNPIMQSDVEFTDTIDELHIDFSHDDFYSLNNLKGLKEAFNTFRNIRKLEITVIDSLKQQVVELFHDLRQLDILKLAFIGVHQRTTYFSLL
jgi:hypothetical protein